jgi:chromosome segregation ATPase
MNGTEEEAVDAPSADPSPKEFLKKHVRGIPREKMKERKVYYGFKYKDLKDFISSIIAQYKDVESPELLARISELELKIDTLQKQKEALGEDLEEARNAGPDPAALKELEDKLAGSEEARASLEAEKAALEGQIQEMEQSMAGTVDEHAKRAQELAAELAALKETFEKLEKENEFLDGEVEKLETANKQLKEENEDLRRQMEDLKASIDDQYNTLDQERAALQEKVDEMEKIIAASSDSQKLVELEKKFESYRKLLKAYETAVSEAVDMEYRPDPEEVATCIQSVRGRVPEDGKAAEMIGLLENLYNTNETVIQKDLETMYEGKGNFRVILDLGKAFTRSQQLVQGIQVLDQVTQ